MNSAPLRVGIIPAEEHARRPRLWSALQAAYPVRFEGRARGALRELDAVLMFGEDEDHPEGGLPCLLLNEEEAAQANSAPRALALASDSVLARPLHEARLSEAHSGALDRWAAPEHELVLARLDEVPAWTLARTDPGSPTMQRVACAPVELEQDEALRDRLRPGRSLALLALAQFLRNLCEPQMGTEQRSPTLHATFLIDDPNLHWPSYGHLHFPAVLEHARACGYHLSIAMVPLDGWFTDPRVARLFRASAAQLSICVHGNEHYGPELGRPRSVAEGVALGAQALRRVAAFERRTGIAVDRVMVPPHERTSEPMARALVTCGFQALCTTRPYPWAVTSPSLPWLTRPAEAGPLAAWGPVDVVAGGLTVLLRADLALHPREDLVLRAFLGQPLILYGHHELLRDGPGALADAAAAIDRLGEVRWCSLAEIAHACAPDSAPAHTAADSAAAQAASTVTALPLQPRRLRPVLRRVTAEGKVRVRAVIDARKASA